MAAGPFNADRLLKVARGQVSVEETVPGDVDMGSAAEAKTSTMYKTPEDTRARRPGKLIVRLPAGSELS